ncbi:hypothetical protein KP509_37G023900 [Ceratopteris richardii]|uniref:phospholipase A2 n=1 Tax=Ceratopteris richardii TaxID=49495 RepID=A0A8T2Q7A6_CERRI|nr:hypothetical protein KP509_37G023900 [Ceratopteris richardii]
MAGIVQEMRASYKPMRRTAFYIVLFLIASIIPCIYSETAEFQAACSRECAEVQCNSLGIRYGKFCGVGWTGCADERPCDDLDNCCKEHDLCVEKKGMTEISCHKNFKKCMRKVVKLGKRGFSKKCPYEVVVPLMIQGMDMAIMFSELGGLSSTL